MQSTPVFNSGNRRHTGAHGLDERLKILERAAWEHTVTEVEDVTRPARREPEHAARTLDNTLGGPEEDRPVQVALHTPVVADPLPSLIQVDTPVERDHVRAGLRDQIQQPRGRGSEMNPGNVK